MSEVPEGTGVTWGLRDIEGGPESDFPLVAGEPLTVAEHVIRVLAPNPGLMTGPGTNTYVIGDEAVIVVDPGPEDESHFEAIDRAVAGRRVEAVVATHHHSDHAPGSGPLSKRFGCVFAAHPGKLDPDRELNSGDFLTGIGERVRVVHTPGHASDHICLILEERALLFSGDHVMGGSTVVIAPPDGDMAAYMESIGDLKRMEIDGIFPGHGQPVGNPAEILDWYLTHRREREAEIAANLGQRIRVSDLVDLLYADVPREAHPVAAMSVWAHLIKLESEGRARRVSGEKFDSVWESGE